MHMREVTIGYGMTETSPVSTQTALDDPLDKRVGTVGRVHPHVEVKIVDPATGGRAARHARRAVHARLQRHARLLEQRAGHAHVHRRRRLDAHAATWRPWTKQGYVNIVGRLKDMIIRGGENIYPREIEEFLLHPPAVSDAQVIGVPEQQYGEEVMAWIKCAPARPLTADELHGVLQGPDRHLQDPALLEVRGRLPDDRDRQDPEVPDARDRDHRTRRIEFQKGFGIQRIRSESLRPKRAALPDPDAYWHTSY